MSTLRDIVGSDEPTTIENMQADRPLVDLLYSRGVINKKARRKAFDTLYPRNSTRKLVLNSILGIAAAFFAAGFIMIMVHLGPQLLRKLRGVKVDIGGP